MTRIQALCTAVCFQTSATPTTFLESSTTWLQPGPTLAASTRACNQHPHLQPAPTLAASTHACSQHPRLQPAPTRAASTHACCHHDMLAASTHACSQHPRLEPAPTLAARTHACSQHPRVQAAPTLAGSTHACCHHARLQPAPNACRRDFARQRTSISPRCPAFFLSLDSLPVQPAECVKGSSSLANALFPDSLGIQRLFPVQALFLRPPHLFLLWLSRSRCPAPHVKHN